MRFVAPLLLAFIVAQPWLGRWRWRQLLARVHEPGTRVRHYRRALVMEWLWTALIFAGVAVDGRVTLAALGLRAPRADLPAWVLAAIGVPFTVSLIVPLVMRKKLAGAFGEAAPLLPRTPAERAWFVPLAISAGFCEELLYRGFLLWLVAPRPTWVLYLVGSLPFGFGHIYQGARNAVITAVVGALAVFLMLLFGSLWPAIAMHALIDVRAAFMFPSAAAPALDRAAA